MFTAIGIKDKVQLAHLSGSHGFLDVLQERPGRVALEFMEPHRAIDVDGEDVLIEMSGPCVGGHLFACYRLPCVCKLIDPVSTVESPVVKQLIHDFIEWYCVALEVRRKLRANLEAFSLDRPFAGREASSFAVLFAQRDGLEFEKWSQSLDILRGFGTRFAAALGVETCLLGVIHGKIEEKPQCGRKPYLQTGGSLGTSEVLLDDESELCALHLRPWA